ncbi:MAG: ATP-binding protein, partial [Opitutales bacterium]
PVRNGEGELIGTLSVALDISELKRTEGDLRHAIDQARAASRAKGEFLAAISHEIRTPINGIIGASELCEETRLDREQRNYIDTVLQCGETLLSLVNDVLDFSKIEAGQLNLEKLNFVPRALLESVAESFMQETRKRGIELITAYDEKLPHYLMGDPTRLKQVLNNLVSNAVKFTETGEIVIRVETLELAEESARVRFSVSDTGIGISEARQDAIFESFTQEDMSTTRKYGGTGLGLSISRELVQLMEGEIQLKSELGKGSTFSFEVNFERSAYPGAEAVPFNPEPAEMRILIVEDNPVNQAVAEQRLKKLGHEVTVAGDSYEALETILKKRFDCILMDIQMPGMDGYQTTAEIRKFEKEHEIDAQYIVAMTAHAMKGDEERCLSVGMDNYIAKPFRVERLKEVLHLAAGHKRRKKGAGSAPSYSYAGYLAALSKADREDLMDAGRILLQSLPADIEKLNKAMAAKDFKQCSFQAHTLKSVVAHFGHEVATSLAEELEKASEKEQEIEVLSLAREFIESLQALTAQIEAECEKFRA